MAKALYRKYRPCSLSEVVGQEQVTEVLANSLKQGKISHAYLFIGPRGTGKTSVARIFAHEINEFPYSLEDDYVDIIEIDGASNRGVDNIRELREKVVIAPTTGKYKVYIIDEVHMLTKEAFNALLKTLEEPPEHVVFIMATTDAYKVPVTITSRAQTYTFRLASAEVMRGHLRKVADTEGIKIDDAALLTIVKRGGGSFRDSLSLLDQISTLSDDLITAELVNRALGLPEDEKIRGLISSCVAGDVVEITTLLRGLLSTGVKPETLVEEMMRILIDEPSAESLPLLARLTEIRAPIAEFGEAKLLVALVGDLVSGTRAAVAAPAKIVSAPAKATNAPERPRVAEERKPIAKEKNDAEEAPVVETATNAGDFDWEAFLSAVEKASHPAYMQLLKCEYSVGGDELNIYPESKLVQTILSKDEKKRILIENAGGRKVILREFGEHPKAAKKDALISQISDIMGGEVKNDGGDNPF